MKAQLGNRLEHWEWRTGTTQGYAEAENVPAKTKNNKFDKPNVAKKDGNCWVWLSEVKTMVHQVLIKWRKNGNSQIAEMAQKSIFDAMETCALEAEYGIVRSIVSLTISSVVADDLDNVLVAFYIQKAVLRAAVYPAIIKAVFRRPPKERWSHGPNRYVGVNMSPKRAELRKKLKWFWV